VSFVATPQVHSGGVSSAYNGRVDIEVVLATFRAGPAARQSRIVPSRNPTITNLDVAICLLILLEHAILQLVALEFVDASFAPVSLP
jgi:hypothetical protein